MEGDFGIDPNDLFPEKCEVITPPTRRDSNSGGNNPEATAFRRHILRAIHG